MKLHSRRTFLVASIFLLLFFPSATDLLADGNTKRVFTCAHSFMVFTAKLLPPIAKSGGWEQVDAGTSMIGGSTCIQHWNQPDEKNKTKAALQAGVVDVLTLSPYYVMPDPGIDLFTRLGLEKNPNLKVFVQSSWPAFDSPELEQRQGVQAGRNAVTLEKLREIRRTHHDGWQKKLETQVAKLNQEIGKEVVKIIPVSDAVFELREKVILGKVPGLKEQADLFRDDIGHPTPALAILVTYCHYAAIYGKSPVGLPVPELLEGKPDAEGLVRILQEIAWRSVSEYRMDLGR